ncbi:C69 family dipeptidase [Companilactobacillus nodensis]|uniref:Dipeptidase n=1 Tax=Companilactobacillus nodensis DSM 19682 = JCM 14932 = NBRC 107160 TaxID=1423775 RepID=A0A0R1KDF0_9LACO|nr:C69 family dipeptidase [Companilactobacillus nodensis]KRK78905.1 dipeptidase A [Companilactobacillus nodensis DSM 19682 = JCM 14932 = NBRC 107160]
MQKHSACSSIMVGKKAAMDGSTYIARNEDNYVAIYPKKFYVEPAVSGQDKTYKSFYNDLTEKLPANGYRYTTSPDANTIEGLYEEDGINEKDVAMSATESVYGNEKVLGYDPLVPEGVAEDSITTLVLPYVDSARAGVKRLGELIAKYGSAESNGVQFSDHDEIWYMEIATGHQWVAIRIPDDCYAFAANQIGIEEIDFSNSDNYMWSDGIREFVEEHDLNPDEGKFNFRHIFGTDTKTDHHYNTPRVWFAQKYLNPSTKQDPESPELPFLRKPEHKISVEDIQYVLKSHYNETQFDPLGSGSEDDKKRYRSISLSRTANSHILQLKNDKLSVEWKCFGIPSFTPFVPFFTNANDTDETYRDISDSMNLKDAYWIYEALSMVVETHYAEFIEEDLDYQKELSQWAREKVDTVEDESKSLSGTELIGYLTKQNHEIATYYNDKAKALLGKLVTEGAELSKLTFKMDPNL